MNAHLAKIYVVYLTCVLIIVVEREDIRSTCRGKGYWPRKRSHASNAYRVPNAILSPTMNLVVLSTNPNYLIEVDEGMPKIDHIQNKECEYKDSSQNDQMPDSAQNKRLLRVEAIKSDIRGRW